MLLPSANTPLYSHPLPAIEEWLRELGFRQDPDELHLWNINNPSNSSRAFKWRTNIVLDIQEIIVLYQSAAPNGTDIKRSFQYSLSRQDIEDAIFSGP